MPTRSQYQHPYLQNLPESESQALAARCRQWRMQPVEFVGLINNWFRQFTKEADCHQALKLFLALEHYNGADFNDLLEKCNAAMNLTEQTATNQPEWASAAGEDAIGPWAEIHVGNVVQRLRYVSAGKFMMGSPPGEEGRQSMEGPQHLVAISQGFWMADTACTQALWTKVMGENPSRFTELHGGGPECPVENVNWFRVQTFLQALEHRVPGCHLTLPTEAEWEYACRAGSQTPFSFGANITTEQVNYNGAFPYGKAAKGEFRERTVPVKSLAANAWGLYQMHGNVVEWCADELRIYEESVGKAGGASDAEVTDPGLNVALSPLLGNQETARVLRGGSWFSFARLARSAFRIALRPDWLYVVAGFRLVVRVKSEEGEPEV